VTGCHVSLRVSITSAALVCCVDNNNKRDSIRYPVTKIDLLMPLKQNAGSKRFAHVIHGISDEVFLFEVLII